jgi:hypothetical protein
MAIPTDLPTPHDIATNGAWGDTLNDAIRSLHLGPDTHANIPAASGVPKHALYKCTTHNVIHITDGSTWSDYADLSGTGGGGGGGSSSGIASIWSSILSLPLSTLTGWTAGTGTWAVSSGVIRQSSTSAGSNRLRYTATKLNTAACIVEVDIKMDVATSTSLSRAGILFDYPPGADVVGADLVGVLQGTSGFVDRIYAEYEGVQAGPSITFTPTIPLGTWFTLRCMKIGRDVSIWIDGTFVGQVALNSGNSDASTIAFYTYDSDTSFRNLDVWSISADTSAGTTPNGTAVSGYQPGSADVPPSVPNAQDDEFNTTSTATWTATPTAPATWNVDADRQSNLHLRSSGSTALVGRYQAVPASYPYTITAKLEGTSARSNFHRGGGIFIAPASPTGASAAIYLGALWDTSIGQPYFARLSETLGGTFSSVSGSRFMLFRESGSYLKMTVNSATSVDLDVSGDGYSWMRVETGLNPGFTPGVMGICASEDSVGGGVDAYFDWFRVNWDPTKSRATSAASSGVSAFPLTPLESALHPVYGDHCTGSGLATKWNRNGYVLADEQYQKGGGSWLQVDAARAANNYYWQTAPASGDYALVMGLVIQGGGANIMFGPLILDSSGNGVQSAIYLSADGYYTLGCSAGAYNSTNTTVAANGLYVASTNRQRLWLRLKKVGTSYKSTYSLDGATWAPETGGLTFATTPTRIGFGSILGTPKAFAIDFFDVQ